MRRIASASSGAMVSCWTLWARRTASVAAIDPETGKVTRTIDLPDAYNMYFTPDGRSAIVVAEAKMVHISIGEAAIRATAPPESTPWVT